MQLDAVLDGVEQANEQAVAWLAERDRLIDQAKALGASHRRIASRTSLARGETVLIVDRATAPVVAEP
jgi:hypothetical protein